MLDPVNKAMLETSNRSHYFLFNPYIFYPTHVFGFEMLILKRHTDISKDQNNIKFTAIFNGA